MSPNVTYCKLFAASTAVRALSAIFGFAMLLAQTAVAHADKPYGIDHRTPWTASHIHGTPEPPPPFRSQRAFPNLTFKNPLDIAFAPGGSRVFVAEQFGKIYSFPNDVTCAHADLFADLTSDAQGVDKVPYATGVGAVYGFTFDPHFQQNRFVYICYVLNFSPPAGVQLNPKNQFGSRVSRFTVAASDPPRIDPASEKVIITWYAGGHNGGCIKFGPDGCLYISTGDGGDPDPPDPFDTGQDISDLLCSILRIDVSHPAADKPYSIPSDNPFIHTPGARPEVFAYGLRNPWRMNFDSATGNLWVGDVGWELWESICCCKAGTNCGWSIMEGPNPVHPQGRLGPTPLTPPAFSLPHTESCSITGGFVYHGKKLPELSGHYLFGDWQTARLWAARCEGDKLQPYRLIAQTSQRIVAFGEQPDGEPLIVDHGGGGLWRIVPNEAANHPVDFPRKLSQAGLFTDLAAQTPAPGVLPYSINAPQWLDGATAQRWVAVPGDQKVFWGKGVWGDDRINWPQGSVLVRTVSLASKNIETQLLHFDGMQWQAYSYKWNDAQNDADLVDAQGDDKIIQLDNPPAVTSDSPQPGPKIAPDPIFLPRQRKWNFASRAQCLTCHNVWCNFVLSFEPPQLERDAHFADATDNQVRTFRHLGLLIATPPPGSDAGSSSEKLTLTNPYDGSADLTERARSYLHVNCSVCHRFGGGGSALFDVRKELPLHNLNLLDAKPNLGGFGLDDARLVCPGDPNRSVLLYRMSKLGRGRMPHIGSDAVDVQGLTLLRQWIAGLGNSPAWAAHDAELAELEKGSTSAATRLLSTTTGAMALLGAIDAGRIPPAVAKPLALQAAASDQEPIKDLFRRFDPSAQQVDRLGPNINPAKLLALRGDAERGGKIFFEQSATGLCARCHIVSGRGIEFGPDLSHIASKYNRADLLDNILNPSKTIAQGYATYVVRTRTGDIYSGLLFKQSPQQITLKDAQLKQTTLSTSEIDKMVPQPISAMPEGLLSDLTGQQAADLLDFVASLK
ncbi:MAG TPA: PQQ-dependent sugar dehydrogenase [Tepidisphaeraceae bacterium]|nr:PQQ-dependent sugar dehydrogenase [Tepidisphaeraceae bacterium]